MDFLLYPTLNINETESKNTNGGLHISSLNVSYKSFTKQVNKICPILPPWQIYIYND